MTFRTLFTLLIMWSSLQAQTLSHEMWGYSFQTPARWQYQNDAQGALLGHQRVPGIILVYPHRLKSMNALRQEMLQGLHEEEGYLKLKGTLQKMGKNGYMGHYVGVYGGEKAKATGYGTLSPYGGGVIIIAMSTPQAYSKALDKAAKSITRSLHYKKQQTAGLMQRFVGKWQTWSKYSESSVYLYPDGTYEESSSSSYGNADASAGAVWGAANDSGGRGHWQVRGNAREGELIFTDANGESGSYPYHVHVSNGETYWSEYYFGDTLYQQSPLQ